MRLAIALAIFALACGEPETPRPLPRERPVEAPEPPEPPREAPRGLDQVAPSEQLPAAPGEGCAFGAPVRVWASPGWAAIAADAEGFVVAGTAADGEGERVFAVRVRPDGTTQTIADSPLDPPLAADHRRAPPAVAATRDRAAIAVVFGDRSLRVAEIGASALSWRSVGTGASVRFSPALAADRDGWIAAWTDERQTPMRVHARRIADEDAHQILPQGGSASAPVFLENATDPVLMFLDAREGMSVAHRVAISRGAFAEPTVARPINLVASPPEIAAVRIGDSEWVAYTAVGSGATSAVGLVRVGGNEPPTPIVRGTGYGVLHVSVASLDPERAIFAADAPQASAPDAPREVHVRIARESGLENAIVIHGPSVSGAASRSRIAHAGGGLVGVSFSDDGGIFTALGRCAVH